MPKSGEKIRFFVDGLNALCYIVCMKAKMETIGLGTIRDVQSSVMRCGAAINYQSEFEIGCTASTPLEIAVMFEDVKGCDIFSQGDKVAVQLLITKTR